MKSHLGLVSWDVDGTLYDTRVARRWLMARPWRLGPRDILDLWALRRYESVIEQARDKSVAVAAARPRMVAAAARLYAPAIAAAGLRPGVLEVLQALAARHVPQGVFSDYDSAAKLAALGVRGYF